MRRKTKPWGGILRMLRKQAGLTLDVVSKRSGVQPAQISNYERDKMPNVGVETINKILRAYGHELVIAEMPNPWHLSQIPERKYECQGVCNLAFKPSELFWYDTSWNCANCVDHFVETIADARPRTEVPISLEEELNRRINSRNVYLVDRE